MIPNQKRSIALTISMEAPGARTMKTLGSTTFAAYCRAVFDRRAKTESASARVCPVVRSASYLGAVAQGVRASGISDAEGVLGEESQGSLRSFGILSPVLEMIVATFKFSDTST